MKKFSKVSLIAAGILLVIGCMLGAVSAIAGGRTIGRIILDDDYDDELDDKIERFVMNAGKSVYYATDGKFVFIAGKASDTSTMAVMSDRFDASEIRNMELELGAGTFTIEEKDTDEIEVYVSGKKIDRCNYYSKGDTFYIEGFKDSSWRDLNDSYIEVEVKVPTGSSFEKIELETGASIVKISGIKVNKLEAVVGAGELYLNGIEMTKLDAEIGAGRMDASAVSAQDAEINVGMGECIYDGAITGNLDAECGMGNMDFTLEGKETDHNYEIECSAGSVDIGSFYTEAFAAEKRINNNAASKFDIECSMGNVSISFKDSSLSKEYAEEKYDEHISWH